MGEIEKLPDGPAKDFLKRLSAADSLEDVRAIRLMIMREYTGPLLEELADERRELLAAADDRIAGIKKGKLAPPVVRPKPKPAK